MLPNNPMIPAFRIRDGRSCLLCFRCAFCDRAHCHGCGDGSIVQWRGADCCDPPSEFSGKNYQLVHVGDVSSARMLPSFDLDDLIAFNRAISSVRQG